jgi:gamma-glutamyltranspeptidase/glutathione hydrolase
MAPTVARRPDGAVLAAGTPGADRITTALSQVLYNTLVMGMPLRDAVEAPRLHVETFEGEATAAHEPGLSSDEIVGLRIRPFSSKSMYFGAVQAAAVDPDGELTAVADSRRGGVGVVGGT